MADTNFAMAYYQFGLAEVRRQPALAADAFYWASRLTPQWAEPYYARRVALILSEGNLAVDYLFGSPRVAKTTKFRFLDSLQYMALARNPFLIQSLDRLLIEEVVYGVAGSEGLFIYGRSRGDLISNAWSAYTSGQYARAAEYFGTAIRKYPKATWLHASRANAFAAQLKHDSAALELTTMLEKRRKVEDKEIVHFYDSKAMIEYSIGVAHSLNGNAQAARDAYERALTEDLALYMAHAALGDLAMQRTDTAQALSEYALAVELKQDDPALRFGYALALLKARRENEGALQFAKAIEIEPYFAHPHYYLGRLYDAAEMPDQALIHYTAFVAKAPRIMVEREWVVARLADLAKK
ncbi:MAG: hypothetical protein H7Z74_08075 [Anaerolineae bacterium]|nr:hypothetical protein [Gemmatimonadaceae bacterium]